MEKLFRIGMSVLMASMLSACSVSTGQEDKDIQLVESEPIEVPEHDAVSTVESSEHGMGDNTEAPGMELSAGIGSAED